MTRVCKNERANQSGWKKTPRNPLAASFFKYYTPYLVSWWMMGDSEWFQVLRRASFGREGSDMASASHRDVTGKIQLLDLGNPEMTQFVSFQVGVKHLYIVYTYAIYIYTIYMYIYIHIYMDVFISLLVIPKPLLFGWEWWRSAGTWRLDLRQMGLGSRHFGRMEAQWLKVGLFFQWHANNTNWRSSNICEQWKWGLNIHVR